MEFEPGHDDARSGAAEESRRIDPSQAKSHQVEETSLIDPAEHNIVFLSLVTGDSDIVGLVAYSIYKQNKYDWLMAFSRHIGRMPNPDEVQSYIYGESTPRRLATYRHLAEATLEGRGLEVPGLPPHKPTASRALTLGSTATPAATSGRPLLIGIIIAIIIAAGLIWYFHGGPAPSTK